MIRVTTVEDALSTRKTPRRFRRRGAPRQLLARPRGGARFMCGVDLMFLSVWLAEAG